MPSRDNKNPLYRVVSFGCIRRCPLAPSVFKCPVLHDGFVRRQPTLDKRFGPEKKLLSKHVFRMVKKSAVYKRKVDRVSINEMRLKRNERILEGEGGTFEEDESRHKITDTKEHSSLGNGRWKHWRSQRSRFFPTPRGSRLCVSGRYLSSYYRDHTYCRVVFCR